ncbi:MAG: radical SAM protein [Lachnospiraceae bacterium]|nr:radical SAM protein [Lachnospiraceae bacterium]
MLCHRHCGIDRTKKTGYCGMTDRLFAARAALHFWEEPCISGESGSGTVFFSGCSLRCAYCQNHDIALGLSGKGIDPSRLAEIFLELQEKGAANINLVTPTHYVPSIIVALERARNYGLILPVVYNTGNYETLSTIKMLEGFVDVYLPDFKYWSQETAIRYSAAPNYAAHAAQNIAEMFRQVGEAQFAAPQGNDKVTGAKQKEESETCLMTRGLIVRHLLLPGALSDAKNIIRSLYETYGDAIYLSILNQYTPIAKNLFDFPELNRKITQAEYDEVVDYAIELGVENAFIQEGETAEESFIPDFCGEGI